MSKFLFRAAAICVPAMFLAACGGGGGDDGDGGGLSSGVVITTANAKAVSADALDASTNLGAAANSGLVVGVQVDATGLSASPMRLYAAARTFTRMPVPPALATGAAVTGNCSLGGTLTLDGQVQDSSGNTLNTGDWLSISANNCRENVDGAVVTMNGRMRIDVLRGPYTANSSSYPKSVSMKITATQFSMVENGVTMSSNGDMTVDLTETSATASVGTVTSSSLTNTTSSGAGSRSTTLKNYAQKSSVTASGTSIEVSGSVETNNSRLGVGTKLYTIKTIAPITMTASGDFTGGTLEVVGANATALRLTVTGTNTFGIAIDADGNGSFESSATATRSELAALL
ncbi:MAG TPA: hypothetical protein VNB23_11935 [Ramlibacter sp.]|nr:hypothetical protein [Ramlibacter sp.]